MHAFPDCPGDDYPSFEGVRQVSPQAGLLVSERNPMARPSSNDVLKGKQLHY